MEKKSNHNSAIFFSSFVDELNNSHDLVSETLKEHNVNEKELSDKANAVAGKLLSQLLIRTAKEKKKSLLAKASELLTSVKLEIQSLNPKEKLFQLLSANMSAASFTFNSLRDFSNEDVLQMLSEIELLELIEELEKKSDK